MGATVLRVIGARPNGGLGGFGGLFQPTCGNWQISILTLLPARLKVTPNPPQTPIELSIGLSERTRLVACPRALCAAPVTAPMGEDFASGLSAFVVRRRFQDARRAYHTPSPQHRKNLGRNSASRMRFIHCALLMAGRVRSQTSNRPLGGGFFVRDAARIGKGGNSVRHPDQISTATSVG